MQNNGVRLIHAYCRKIHNAHIVTFPLIWRIDMLCLVRTNFIDMRATMHMRNSIDIDIHLYMCTTDVVHSGIEFRYSLRERVYGVVRVFIHLSYCVV